LAAAAEFDGASLAEDAKGGFKILGAYSRRGFNGAKPSIRKSQHGDCGIFRLDVRQIRLAHRIDALHVAAEPDEQVNCVDRLVRQYAAVVSPGSAPTSFVVILLMPAPAQSGREQRDLAEASVIVSLPQGSHCTAITPLLNDEESGAAPFANVNRSF